MINPNETPLRKTIEKIQGDLDRHLGNKVALDVVGQVEIAIKPPVTVVGASISDAVDQRFNPHNTIGEEIQSALEKATKVVPESPAQVDV